MLMWFVICVSGTVVLKAKRKVMNVLFIDKMFVYSFIRIPAYLEEKST